MQSLKSVLVVAIIAICVFTTNSYTFNKMIMTKNTFVCNKKCNNCVFNNFKTLPNSKNFTRISESEQEKVDIFIQEGEINLMD